MPSRETRKEYDDAAQWVRTYQRMITDTEKSYAINQENIQNFENLPADQRTAEAEKGYRMDLIIEQCLKENLEEYRRREHGWMMRLQRVLDFPR
eukprot:2616691-Rhodomonas_salina.1